MSPGFWDERYSEEGFAYGERPNDFLLEVLDRLPVGHTLSLAEGEGRNARALAERGHRVTAVDLSEVGLDKARRLLAAHDLSLDTVVANLADYTIEVSAWTCVVSVWAHVPPELRRRIHAQIVRGLKPGGMLVLEAYTPAQVGRGTGGPPDPALTMTLDGLRDELDGLRFEIGRELERDVREGRYHGGLSSVVQVLAVRD